MTCTRYMKSQVSLLTAGDLAADAGHEHGADTVEGLLADNGELYDDGGDGSGGTDHGQDEHGAPRPADTVRQRRFLQTHTLVVVMPGLPLPCMLHGCTWARASMPIIP